MDPTQRLPPTHCKIIVRPRDGLDLRKTSCYGISTAIFFKAAAITATQASTDLVCPNVVQNILVVCTDKEDNARKILALKHIRNYVKGVVRNVEHDIGDAELARLIHIKETGSVVLVFDEVPSYIRVGQAIVRCYLFKKDIEVCSKCSRVGHRADVCPTPMVNLCHNCGAKDPQQEHWCHVRCKLCGKATLPETKPANRKAKGMRNGTCLQPEPAGFPNGRGQAAWAVFWRLADPRFPPLRNGPPRKKIENLLEHQLDPLPDKMATKMAPTVASTEL
ncbi:hypothetical protein HPB49_003959 [Dermacentor silvarum]|uniref:Uncharacterized protein n=1 Tax=Dermacentor silvarum TaxID=543639 RepID=A0ACB8C213_DERSI|nr:hypothetical protein HPB49_003959 [Dermacentor silvarum]